MNRKVIAMLACAVLTIANGLQAEQAADDRAQIEQTARDYIEGWYTADAERMARALHPDLIKRIVEAMPDGHQVIKSLTRDQMVQMTGNGGGSQTPADKRDISVQVLDISGTIAAAKTVSAEFVDLLTLSKVHDRWVIVNILWAWQHPPDRP